MIYFRHHGLLRALVPGLPVVVRRPGQEIWLARRHGGHYETVVENFDDIVKAVMSTCRVGLYWVWDFSRPAGHVQWISSGGQHIRMFYTGLPELWSTCQKYVEWLQIKPGEAVLDIGAYCGLSTIAFAKALGPKGIIYGLEPDRENFEALQQNMEKFHHRDQNASWSIQQAAVGAQLAIVDFHGEASFSSGISNPRGQVYGVQMVRLQDVTNAHVDAVKIDAEGAEYDIIYGAADWLKENHPRLLIECHNGISPSAENAAAVAINLRGLGYKCELIPPFSWEQWHVLAMPRKGE